MPTANGAQPGNPSQAWLHARARLAPNLLSQSPPWVHRVYEHAWAPMQALNQQIDCLPPALWRFLLQFPGGFAVIVIGKSRYAPGPQIVAHQPRQNVAFVSIEDLARESERPLHVLGRLIDHHLGCGGKLDGTWLSEGGGTTDAWRDAGARIAGIYDLGYALDDIARSNIRAYFAQSLAIYCKDEQRLNVADPQIHKWFRNTLWSEAFWRQIERQGRN